MKRNSISPTPNELEHAFDAKVHSLVHPAIFTHQQLQTTPANIVLNRLENDQEMERTVQRTM